MDTNIGEDYSEEICHEGLIPRCDCCDCIGDSPNDRRIILFSGHYYARFDDWNSQDTYLLVDLLKNPLVSSSFAQENDHTAGNSESPVPYSSINEEWDMVDDFNSRDTHPPGWEDEERDTDTRLELLEEALASNTFAKDDEDAAGDDWWDNEIKYEAYSTIKRKRAIFKTPNWQGGSIPGSGYVPKRSSPLKYCFYAEDLATEDESENDTVVNSYF